ncbi:hypothetical protein RLEG12_24720 [Rhizobium leguminosarum bv. trifolii CB782]|nr:hypothetical protein RLEG12_24720 [Rhizobium leguminosarum bv. trifolii CB782]
MAAYSNYKKIMIAENVGFGGVEAKARVAAPG